MAMQSNQSGKETCWQNYYINDDFACMSKAKRISGLTSVYLQKCGHCINKEKEKLGGKNVQVVESFARDVNKCNKWTNTKEQKIS